MKNRNNLLDFLKGCGCLGVVFIHVQFPGVFGTIVHILSQYAVPVFYMVAGYYAYDDSPSRSTERMIRKVKHIGRITLYALVFYILYASLIQLKNRNMGEWLFKFVSWKLWMKILILGDFDIIGASHLWFLPAMIYAYFILFYIEKRGLQKAAFRMMPVLFVLKIAVTAYTLSFNISWHLSGNIICALPWMLLGNYIACNEKFRTKFASPQIFTVSVCVGGGIAVAFTLSDFPINLSEVGIVLLAASLFLLTVNNPRKSPNSFVEKLGRDYSLYVYLFHIAMDRVLMSFANFFGVSSLEWVQWLRPILVAECSVAMAMFICYMFRMKREKYNLS